MLLATPWGLMGRQKIAQGGTRSHKVAQDRTRWHKIAQRGTRAHKNWHGHEIARLPGRFPRGTRIGTRPKAKESARAFQVVSEAPQHQETAQDGTRWHKVAQSGTRCHKVAQDGTRWHKMTQDGTSQHKMAQASTRWVVEAGLGEVVQIWGEPKGSWRLASRCLWGRFELQ